MIDDLGRWCVWGSGLTNVLVVLHGGIDLGIKQVGSAPAVISLFCGAGGLDLGFKQAGYRTVMAVDSMRSAVKSFNAHMGGDTAIELDLLKVPTRELLDAVAARSLEAGVVPHGVIGGPPCQGVSNANTSSGPEDPRNRLFSRYAHILAEADARFSLDFFVLENVPGLRAAKNRQLYERLKKRLAGTFDLSEAVLDASEFGVPQKRKRLFIVGINHRLALGSFTFPVGSAPAPPRTVRDAIFGLPEPAYLVRGALGHDSLDLHPNHWTMRPSSEKFRQTKSIPNARSFQRLDWDRPSRTVAYGNREVHIHPSGSRRLSILEAMLLQGFPDNFRLYGNFSDQVTQVSNAVPPPVAKAIAESLNTLLYSS